MRASAQPARDPEIDLLSALRRQVDQLNGRVEELGDRVDRLEHRHVAVDDDGAEQLLLAVAAAVRQTAFSAREVVAHAKIADPELQAALDVAGIQSPRALGKRFRRLEKREIAGVQLVRLGVDRDGVVWRVSSLKR